MKLPACRRLTSRIVGVAVALMALPTVAFAQHPSGAMLPDSVKPLKVVDPAWIDAGANACTDFFEYANGAWLAHDTIPPAYSSSGVEREMSDRNQLVVRSVLEDAAAARTTLPPDSTTAKLGTFYATCMDSTAAEQAGIAPIRPWLDEIGKVTTRERLVPEIATLQVNGVNVLFHYFPQPDLHDAAHYVAWFYQGGLGLPDRDYYTDSSASGDSTRQAYVAHITKLLTLAGESSSDAERDAGRVLTLETALAKASLTRVAQRDPSATDHLMTAAEMRNLTPDFSWGVYERDIGLASPLTRANVAMPAFMTAVDSLLVHAPLDMWRAYLRYHTVSNAASWLSSPFVNENFAFSSRFSGAKELLPRWKRCLQVSDGEMGEALGKAYVEKTFPPEARARAKQVIDDIKAAFGERLKALTWMSDTTKTRALDKLAKMGEKVGYPDHWRDYTKLQITNGPFVLNVARADVFEWQRVVNRPGEAVDTTEWGMSIPTVNAYYDPSKNEMVFPAGALEPQTFDANADDGANYGALGGSWAGHELTHGFDDEGRHYDAEGNLRDWWTPADSVHFTKEANLVVRQFDGYIQVDTFHVNGKLTLGENIADYGGVLTAYDALERALTRDGRPGLIDGYTPEQRYFLAYAQSWRVHTRPARLRTRVKVDPHSPARWRVNGPLSNDPEFWKAFGCKPGDPMVRPADSIPHIW